MSHKFGYHSYQVDFIKPVNDCDGSPAYEFRVILGAVENEFETKMQLIDLLEKGLE